MFYNGESQTDESAKASVFMHLFIISVKAQLIKYGYFVSTLRCSAVTGGTVYFSFHQTNTIQNIETSHQLIYTSEQDFYHHTEESFN